MWHKKWIEKKEGNGQGEKAGTSSDPETIAPLPADLMDIVGPDGSSLNPPPLGSSVIPDATLNEGIATPVGMSQAGMPNPLNTSTSMELALTPTPASGVWGIPGDMPSVQQIADQTFESAIPTTEFSKKLPASDVAEIEGETIPDANQNKNEDVGGSNSKTEDLDTLESQASSTEAQELSATQEVTDTSKQGCPPDTSEISSASSTEEKTGNEENKEEQRTTKEQMETVDASDNSKASITNKHSEVSKEASSETTSDQMATKTQSEPPAISKEEGETEASEDAKKCSSSEGVPEGGPTSESLPTDKKETHDQREGTDSAQETCAPEEEKQGEEIRNKEAKDSTKEENEEDPEANKSQKDEAADKRDTEIAETKPSGDTKGTESEETMEKEMTPNLGDIELPQEEDIVAADLPQTEEIEAPGDVLDDDDEAQLDDGDDLAAALLSSQTELEQLVTQASSALSPHVSTPSLEPQVVAPIIPEAERIEPVNCKLNLLEHVQVMQSNITKRFDEIEKQLEVLEAEMGLSGDTGNDDCEEESEERDPATLQARALVKLILNDINTVKKIAEFTH
ncbi:protein IWS1 homolog [Penaeus chinensis]|uniref:protein IWS1 homolog n=1 Tax=Penaeus chinensis TaxID=139456 RepID=UPI001FB6993F|nr:protein IWS1 homolog [Penaeus chinensis]